MTTNDDPSPAASLLRHLAADLRAHPPFDRMAMPDVQRLVAAAHEAYYAPGETLLSPADGVVTALCIVRRGAVTGRHGLADAAGGFAHEAGDLFPVGAVTQGRAVTATYAATADTFCLWVPAATVQAVAADSPPFAAALGRRVMQLLAWSGQALQAAMSSRLLQQQSMEQPLAALVRRAPLQCAPDTPLREVLQRMQVQRVGSMVVVDAADVPRGIFTRHDVLDRVALPGVPLDAPVARVMSQPVHALDVSATAHDAALAMSRHGIRHVPVLRDGRLAGMVSERDLFVLQRVSLNDLSSALRHAPDVAALQALAPELRAFARHLLGQGVQARQITELMAHLNDLLAARLVALLATTHGRDLSRACWLAFGSEGRGEQTIATDQDNGLVFDSADPDADRPAWLAFGAAVNDALAACGVPLCTGGVMAGRPACCLSVDEWVGRFGQWIDHGAPEDLLAASIYFDLRPIAGDAALAQPLVAAAARARQSPRFLHLLALQALTHGPPLNWHGRIETDDQGAIDLKLQGTALFVEAARVLALAAGVAERGTRARLLATVGAGGPSDRDEADTAVAGFEFLQGLRLRQQLDDNAAPNRVGVDTLNAIDRRVLKESLRAAQRLQQRLALEYQRA